ncbi:uncharacterized protein F5891DRAFT_162044 [Suillus fuscotomentosus]|uniref:Uncharacterized protein n=1 Tax=Suillus fuscotomentosus TaxID=1912939 RepID=A0AAD4EA31_9AGAM|nr:uncharacterized protein F5891DRAFT_162044 [Suillus fuscotomentosus]KAG1902376.1 hypothetical protein F5891DRAFT_162044 [Suillus fuscotomentosus]
MICTRGYVDCKIAFKLSTGIVAMSSNPAPLLHVVTGGNKSLKGPLFCAMIRACLLAGRVYIAIVIDTGVIAGLALWFPPGKVLWKNDAQKNHGFNHFLESLSSKTREWQTTTYGSALAPFIKTALSHVRPILSSKFFFELFSDCRQLLEAVLTGLSRQRQFMRECVRALTGDFIPTGKCS